MTMKTLEKEDVNEARNGAADKGKTKIYLIDDHPIMVRMPADHEVLVRCHRVHAHLRPHRPRSDRRQQLLGALGDRCDLGVGNRAIKIIGR